MEAFYTLFIKLPYSGVNGVGYSYIMGQSCIFLKIWGGGELYPPKFWATPMFLILSLRHKTESTITAAE